MNQENEMNYDLSKSLKCTIERTVNNKSGK